MPYARPSLAGLMDRIGAAWRARFPGADTNLRQSPDRAIVSVIAGASDEDLTYTDWQTRQLFWFSADLDYLQRWAGGKNVAQKGATQGAGTVTLSGVPLTSTALAGTQLQAADGTIVALTADATTGEDGTVEAPAQAVNGGGAGNIGTGAALSFIGTPAGFADAAVVTLAFAGGADAESIDSLRLRTGRAYTRPSFGGNRNNWQDSALAVAGVTRVFVSAAVPSPGAITVWPLFDDLRPNGIPVGTDAWFRPGTGPSAGTAGAGDQLSVLVALMASPTNPPPICSTIYVRALATQAINVTITGLSTASDAVKAQIATELSNMLVAKVAQQVTPNVDSVASGYTIYCAWINEAASRAAGVRKFDLTLPAADVVIPPGTIAVLGVMTYA